MISTIIKLEVGVVSRSRRLRVITLTETLIILDITKTEPFIVLSYIERNKKKNHVFASCTAVLEIMITRELECP